jgi:hypothetical protein
MHESKMIFNDHFDRVSSLPLPGSFLQALEFFLRKIVNYNKEVLYTWPRKEI